MSEEVKEQEETKETESQVTAAEEKAPESTEETKTESPAAETAETVAMPEKAKKINRLAPEQLNKKISEMEDKNLTQSKYYKHLMERKRELEAS